MVDNICPAEICTGCGACLNSCAHNCIKMRSDNEGFSYPVIDQKCCTDCGVCVKVCPALKDRAVTTQNTPEVFACWNKNQEIQYLSSSGGVFTALAERILRDDGVVVGAAYDKNTKVKHIAVRKSSQLHLLRGSKYVQSDIGQSFREIRTELESGTRVLFCGTPCQVDGLRSYLGEKKQDNLITCDLLCHGVPSPGLFKKYIESFSFFKTDQLKSISFRDKRNHWNVLTTIAYLHSGKEYELNNFKNSFMYGFLNNITLRKVCYKCNYRITNRLGDLTLGDFWGIGNTIPFPYELKNGISAVLINSKIGQSLFQECNAGLNIIPRTLAEASARQLLNDRKIQEPATRESFFADYQLMDYDALARKYLQDKGLKGLFKKYAPSTALYTARTIMRKLRAIIE